jgi:hypothetical protein
VGEVIEMAENIGHCDPLYLFFCHLEWHRTKNRAAYEELLAALDATDPDIRTVAEVLLRRNSLRPQPTNATAEVGELRLPLQ